MSNEKKKIHCIYVVRKISGASGRNSYVRVRELSERFELSIVTLNEIPVALECFVKEICVVPSLRRLYEVSLEQAKGKMDDGEVVFVHTQYESLIALAGFFCKVRLGCRWIYDLWDHPSLNWQLKRGLKGSFKWIFWNLFFRNALKRADGWVIGMHPAVLSTLPEAPLTCKLIIRQPSLDVRIFGHTDKNESRARIVRIIYVGPIKKRRGIELIAQWAGCYRGDMVHFDLIGASDSESEAALAALRATVGKNENIQFRYWGELPHQSVLELMQKSDIGICALDDMIQNYRYAYPIKIAEYQGCGLAVAATRGHGVSEMVRNGVTGVVTAYHQDSFSKGLTKLVQLCSDYQSRHCMRDAALCVARDYWQGDRTREFLDAVEQAVISRSF